jgi:hypothetical protein
VVPDVVGRLVVHGFPVLDVARIAQDPEVAHAPAVLIGLAGWCAYAGHSADSLRHSWRHQVTERALFRPVFGQRYGHVMIMLGPRDR